MESRQRQRRTEKESEMLEYLKEHSLNIYVNQQQGDYQPMPATIYQNGDGDNIAGDKVMGDKIDTQINTDNRGATIANQVAQARDQAQVSAQNFSQTTGISIAELLEIIASLRQTIALFPTEQQESALIDLEDVEAQIKKPANQRSQPRLKKSLTALLAAAAFLASTIAAGNEFAGNLNDFTDTVIDLGSKVGIELPQPVQESDR